MGCFNFSWYWWSQYHRGQNNCAISHHHSLYKKLFPFVASWHSHENMMNNNFIFAGIILRILHVIIASFPNRSSLHMTLSPLHLSSLLPQQLALMLLSPLELNTSNLGEWHGFVFFFFVACFTKSFCPSSLPYFCFKAWCVVNGIICLAQLYSALFGTRGTIRLQILITRWQCCRISFSTLRDHGCSHAGLHAIYYMPH